MKINPRGEWLLIQPDGDTKDGSIYIPDNTTNQYLKGKIEAIGDRLNEHSVGLDVGMTIVYDRVGAISFRFGGRGYTMLKSREVVASATELE